MNKIYRTVWSHARQCMVVASETTRGRSKTSCSRKIIVEAVAAAVLALGAGQTMAAPCAINSQIVSGAQSGPCEILSGQSLTNNGTISGTDVSGIQNGASASGIGSVINAGLISVTTTNPSAHAGIKLLGVSMSGNIVNTNTGVISAGGNMMADILVSDTSIIAGGITNSGSLQGAVGISVLGSSVSNGIKNNNLINVANTGISVVGSSILTGGIINSGSITAQTSGISVDGDSSVDRIINGTGASIQSNGSASSSAGIYVSGSNTAVTAGITNSGTINADVAGISILGSSEVSDGITNNIGATISGGSTGIKVSGASVAGGINNSGSIVSAGGFNSAAIALWSGASVSGGIINRGLIDGGVHGAMGISLLSSILNGGIINEGSIQALGDSASAAIKIKLSSVAGSIVNSGTIRLQTTESSQAALYLSQTTFAGGITNSGTISASGSEATYGIYLDSSDLTGVSGNIINSASGTISGEGTSAGYGIYLSNSSIGGGITNRGLIKGVSPSGSAYGIALNASSISGVITNSGTISGLGTTSGVGIYVAGGAAVGGIANSGLIEGRATINSYGYGLQFKNGTINGDIVNEITGKILGVAGTTFGIGMLFDPSSSVTGSIINSGLIAGSSGGGTGTGIRISGNSNAATVGGIVNLATGTISGTGVSGSNYGIYLGSNAEVTNGITNAGKISGSTYAVYADSTATMPTLDIVGKTSQLIGDVDAVNTAVTVKSGAIFGNTNAFDVKSFAVESGGLFNFGNGLPTTGGLATNGVKVVNGFTNDGIVSVDAGVSPTITGNFIQNAAGTYRMGLTDTISNYGKLLVTGTANVSGSIDVIVNGAPTIANGTTVAGVIHSTGVMTVIPANITVTDNNLFYNFTAATGSGAGNLDLIIAADANALPNAVAPNNPGATGVAQAMQTVYNGGASAGFQPVFDALSNMTSQQLNSALIELTPSMQGAGTQAGVNALHSMNKIIQSRVESVQGLNSGDGTAEQYAWARVFGNWGDQDNHKGVTGFKSQTQGLVIGMDKPINDRIRAGGLFTYANTDLKSNLGSSKVNVDTYQIAAYGSYNIDPQTDINVQMDVGMNKANSTRRIGFMGTTAKSDFDSFNWHLSGGIGRLFELSDKTNVTPAIRIDYTHVKTDGYTENGAGALNLLVNGSKYEEFLFTVDNKFSHKLTDDGLKFVANGSVGYDFINQNAQSTSTFTGGGPLFVSNGLEVSPWIYRGGLGLVKKTDNGVELSARYDAEGRTSGYLNQTASVKARWAF